MSQLPEGILLIDKPVGITSFDIIRHLRPLYGKQKMGHGGTLDPLASGLMILAVGRATKLLHNYLKLPKTYEAEICIGERTTTGDKEGVVVEEATVSSLEPKNLEKAVVGMVGVLRLPVPAYSAIKQGGEALYKKARRGEEVDVPIREMEVTGALLKGVREAGNRVYVNVSFSVGSGTYIRSLAEELGTRLGFPARLENLRRTQIGDFHIEDATPLD